MYELFCGARSLTRIPFICRGASKAINKRRDNGIVVCYITPQNGGQLFPTKDIFSKFLELTFFLSFESITKVTNSKKNFGDEEGKFYFLSRNHCYIRYTWQLYYDGITWNETVIKLYDTLFTLFHYFFTKGGKKPNKVFRKRRKHGLRLSALVQSC